MAQIELQTFGFPALRVDDRDVRFALRRGLALLVYLADAKGVVSRDTLTGLLWPEADGETGRARLRRLLHRTESALGRRVFEADRHGVRWAAAGAVSFDAHAFEEACDRGNFQVAARIYRGDFLDGFSIDNETFDDWAFHRREALRGRLIHALERLALGKLAAGDPSGAVESAARLAALDPLSEVYARYVIRSLSGAGDRSAAERHFAALSRRLGDELGVSPEAETRALLDPDSEPEAQQATRYVRSGPLHLAYRTHGHGGTDLLLMPGFVSSVERLWDLPACRSFIAELASMGRVILFDPRGIGLSDRNVPPDPDGLVEDIDTVLRAVGAQRPVLIGASQCGAACIRFAAEHPRRTGGLVLIGAMAKGSRSEDYPHALSADQFDTWRRRLVDGWGGPVGIETFGPSLAHNPQARAWWAGLLRAASSPGALEAVLSAVRDVDVRSWLPRVAAPTLVVHRREDRAVRVGAGRYIAEHVPAARFVELDGSDHWFFAGAQGEMLSTIRAFVGSLRDRPGATRPRRPSVK